MFGIANLDAHDLPTISYDLRVLGGNSLTLPLSTPKSIDATNI